MADSTTGDIGVDYRIVDGSIKDIFKRRGWSKNTEKAFFAEVYRHFDQAIDKGFGKSLVDMQYNSPDFELITELKTNVASLAAFKNHQFATDSLRALFDQQGNLRTFTGFKDVVLKLNQQYNIQWLKTEYDTAVAQANMARKWQDFEADKDLYPHLKYIQIHRPTKREAHKPWHGIVLPIGHPFWDTHLPPPNDWGCGCDVVQTDAPIDTQGVSVTTMPANKQGFNINPNKHGKIVSDDHPYFKTPLYADIARQAMYLQAKTSFKDTYAYLRTQFQGRTFNIDNQKVTIVKENLKHMLRDKHPRLYFKNALLLKLDQVIPRLEFVFRRKDIKGREKYHYNYYRVKGINDVFFVLRHNTDIHQYRLYSVISQLKEKSED